MNKIIKNKTGKGIMSLFIVIVLLSSVLAAIIFYGNDVTANSVKGIAIKDSHQILIVGSVNDLSQLNEGWYSIRSGFVFYLEHFDSEIPLYIKIQNPMQQNGMLAVDSDGNVEFRGT